MIENTLRVVVFWLMVLGAVVTGCGGGSGSGGSAGNRGGVPFIDGSATGGERNAVCLAGTSAGEVARPQFLMNLEGQTGWYASPVVADLDQDGRNELVAAYYDVYVFDGDGTLLDRADGNGGRVYAPHVVADLDGDGVTEVFAGRGHEVLV